MEPTPASDAAPVPAAPSATVRAPALVAGDCHNCTLDGDGALRCWGCNDHGQLGDGTFAARGTPAPIVGLGPVRDVALGPRGTCVVTDDGAALCWGANAPGSFGMAAEANRPVRVDGVRDAVEVAIGDSSACARTRAGEVHCWGEDRYRRFGGGGGVERVDDDLGVVARGVHLDARGDVCVLADDGRVLCWGPELGQWDPPKLPPTAGPGERAAWFESLGGPREAAVGVTGFVRGARPICVWIGEGTQRRWRCLMDKYGDGFAALHAVTDADPAATPVMSGAHGCALAEGRVRCWGDDREGQVSAPEIDGWTDVVALAVGARHTCARREGGALACWGEGAWAATGDPSMRLTPEPPAPVGAALRPLAGLSGVVDMASGACAIGQGGRIACLDLARGRPAAGLRDVVQVAPGDGHTCARTRAGAVHCWGEWYFGPSNHDGDASDFLRAAKPRRIAGLDAVALAAWGESDCAIARDGGLVCWGRRGEASLRPVRQDEEGAGWIDLAASRWWLCTRRADASVRCRHNAMLKPSPPLELVGVASISVADDRGCAAHLDGRVSCWGVGPVGDGTRRRGDGPVPVRGIVDAAQVSVGPAHTCARTRGGAILCWGDNREGQLGDGTRVPRALPTAATQAVPRGEVVGVAALERSTVVWTDVGEAWIWGASPGE